MQRQIVDSDETPAAEQRTSRADCTPAEKSDKEEEREYQEQDDEAAVDNDGEDVSATFTIVAPTRKNSCTKATMLEDTTTDDATTDDNDEEVSATYTLTPRHSFVGSAAPTETVETTIVVTPPEILINEGDVDSETVRKKLDTEEMEYENGPEIAIKYEIDDEIENEEDESSESEEQNEDTAEIRNVSKAEDEQDELEADDEDEVIEEKALDAEEDLESEDSEIIEINELENEKTESSATKQLASNEISAHISSATNSADTSITQAEHSRPNTLIPLALVGVASSSMTHTTDVTPTTPTSTSAITPTLESPVRLREKRIPYEPDNSSTLAERLRFEASKYSGVGDSDESSASSSTVASKTRSLPPASQPSDAGGINELSTNCGKISLSSRRSLDSSSLSNESQTLQNPVGSISSCGSNSGTAFVTTTTTATAPSSSSGNSSTMAERRPSWRLKFDAGCKVIHCCTTL